jgi:septum formation topological specificity factor MinE
MVKLMNLSLLAEVQEEMVRIICKHMPIDVFGNSICMALKASLVN